MANVYTNGTGGGVWHDTATWDGGAVPGINDRVIVRDGDTLTVEGVCECGDGTRSTSPTAANAQLYIEPGGTLKAGRTADSELRVKGQIYGKAANGKHVIMDWGTESDPIPASVQAWINLNYENSYHLGYYYGIYLYNYNSTWISKFYMHGGLARVRNTYLTQAADAGATVLHVADATNWQVGDKLYLAPRFTSSNNPANSSEAREYEQVEIQSISGNEITLTAATSYDHGYTNAVDQGAGVVVNMTSNVGFTGGGDDRVMYGFRSYRCEVVIRDAEIRYANNWYNYVAAPLQIVYAGFYGDGIVERTVLWGDSRNQTHNRHMYSLLYLYSTYKARTDSIPTTLSFDDIAGLFIKNVSTYRMYYPITTYYGGRPTRISNSVAMGGENYRLEYGFEAYQQPSHYVNCKVVGANYAYHLHNNVDVDTQDCWAIGSNHIANTYNGTAIHRDMRVRYCGDLAYMTSGWRGGVTFYRPDYTDAQLKAKYENLDLVYRAGDLPDGNYVKVFDNQNDTNEQTTYYSYGTVWWNNTLTRNDPHSIGIQSLSGSYVTPYERTFEATAGDALLVGVYVRNITASYVGSLTLKILQGSTVIAEQTFDLTALTADQWSLLSISGTAQKTMTSTFRMEYVGDGGQIALTDFVTPFTADQKAQAMAVWAAAVADNHAAGSFGEYVQQTLAKDQTVTDARDHVETHGDGAWATADVSALALEATVQAVKARTDLIPNDPARTAEVQQVAADVWARAMEGALTYEQGLRIILAVLAGKVAGAGTGTERFRDQADTKDRVVSHVDSNGNRTSVEVDGS